MLKRYFTILNMKKMSASLLFFAFLLVSSASYTQSLPKILTDPSVKKEHYLPDYSYAGYRFSEESLHNLSSATTVLVTDFGAVPNDGLDDTQAVLKALEAANSVEGSVVLQFPTGRFILSDILYLSRSHFTLRGAGSGEGGTILHYPRPMNYLADPASLSELREYLVVQNKVQKEPENNLRLPFSQYAWSGGFIWAHVPGARVKPYLKKYDKMPTALAQLQAGKRGTHEIVVSSTDQLKEGDVVKIEWYNEGGEQGPLLAAIYNGHQKVLQMGSHHWTFPKRALVTQRTTILKIEGKKVTVKDPLLHDLKGTGKAIMTAWEHLTEVGIEHLSIDFPMAPNVAHHIEEGYNAIFLTNIYHGWVNDVRIKNADSGILTEEIANVTIKNIETYGEKLAHYSVAMGAVHNVLVENLSVRNKVRHPLSFNTMSTKSIYKDCQVYTEPILDQHSGANHQNLFDNIQLWITLPTDTLTYPLFEGGGAGYWYPHHGAFTTFWNVKANFNNGHETANAVLLNGMQTGPSARLIGVHANKKVNLEYAPAAYIEATNEELEQVPSLFDYQLEQRMNKF